jgi:cell division protein FtsN
MMIRPHVFREFVIVSLLIMVGCSAVEQTPKKNDRFGLITTPPTYYTTQKGRLLGEKYKDNLDRLVERIVRNPKTANLQFANNIASFGGIGFFTHSATGSVDERFLEVIMGAPETFDTKLDYSAKVYQLFSLYGAELLSILASDHAIDQEKQVNGYGLNLSWRNVVPNATGPRIVLERAVLYLTKPRARSFLKGDLTQHSLLNEAVIFTATEESPMRLVSYRQQELKPDLRSPIQEEILATGKAGLKPDVKLSSPVALAPAANPSIASAHDKSSAGVTALPAREETVAEVAFATNEDSSNTVTLVGNSSEGSTALSAPLGESSTPKKAAANQVKQTVFDREESVGRSASGESIEQQKTEKQLAMTQGDPKAANIPLVAPSVGDPADAEALLEQRGAEPAATEAEAAPEKSSLTRPSSQVLQGFIIQIPFAEKREAERWAETLVRRRHTVSVTETGSGGSVRLRIGSFSKREEAEQELQALRQDGLKGIILNFPNAYRPEMRPSAARGSEGPVSAVQ